MSRQNRRVPRALQPARESAKTLYGVLLGNLGEEFGLALYNSLEDFQRFYELGLERLDELPGLPEEFDEETFDPEQWENAADITASSNDFTRHS